MVFDNGGELVDHVLFLFILEDLPRKLGPFLELSCDATQEILPCTIILASEHDFPQPHVESELFNSRVCCHAKKEVELIVPLGKMFDQSRELIALLIVFLLCEGCDTL